MEDRNEKGATGRGRRPSRRRYLWLLLAAVIFAVMFYFMYYYPQASIGPRQPIYFSHRVHAGVKGIACQFCHPFVARSQNAGLPSVEKCFFCHKYIIPQHPQLLKEWEYFIQKKPVPWIRVFFVPDFVFFNHRPHVGFRKLDCAQCHGDVKSKDRLARFDFQMGFCVDCHRKMATNYNLLEAKGPPPAVLDCWLACHR